jgi:transcriptional regulator with XRE-family HTH domain
MNIKISNRLVELRKKNGYSQEQLAEKLGLSRQAVSKWERAEASPDTDNLICLAKLYNVSLDELLKTDEEDVENIIKDNQEKDSSSDNKVYDNDGDQIIINNDEIQIKDKDGDKVYIKGAHINITDADGEEINIGKKKKNTAVDIAYAVCIPLFMLAYILLGLLLENGWVYYWPILLTAIVIPSFVEAIIAKKITTFLYPILVTEIYCFLGMRYSLWHPWWFLFITIPVFYICFSPIDKLIHKKDDDK